MRCDPIKAAFALPLIMASGLTSAPAHAETAAANSLATVYRPSTLASLLDLNFGTIVANSTGGVIDLDVNTSSRVCQPGLVCSGGYAFATLQLTGSNAVVVVTYEPLIQLTGPGDPMNVLIQFPGGSGALVPITNNSTTIQFGALLTVNPSQLPGDYSGLFSVNVNYP